LIPLKAAANIQCFFFTDQNFFQVFFGDFLRKFTLKSYIISSLIKDRIVALNAAANIPTLISIPQTYFEVFLVEF